MHEVSLAGGILDIVEKTCARDPFERVTSLRLEAGALSGVDVRALRFALESIAPGTLLAQSHIDIDEPAATAWCMPCAQTVEIRSRLDACPYCASHQLQPTGSTELRVVDMQVI